MKNLWAKKKDNKGFSLVELIVVILIMAIIAVALAPQVMKWVGTSRDSADDNNEANLKSAVSAAVADYMATGQISADKVFTVHKDGLKIDGASTAVTVAPTGDTLMEKVFEVMNGDFPSLANKITSGSTEVAAVFQVTIHATTGQVTVARVEGTY